MPTTTLQFSPNRGAVIPERPNNFSRTTSRNLRPLLSSGSLFGVSLSQLLTVFRLDQRNDGGDIQDYLLTKTGQSTVPNVFVGACFFDYVDIVTSASRNIAQQHIGGKLLF